MLQLVLALNVNLLDLLPVESVNLAQLVRPGLENVPLGLWLIAIFTHLNIRIKGYWAKI